MADEKTPKVKVWQCNTNHNALVLHTGQTIYPKRLTASEIEELIKSFPYLEDYFILK